ncbi:hypothetical protein JHK82_017058 [Glycine max]|nr:hypothetical protein JHK82_017058 [Glycine max]
MMVCVLTTIISLTLLLLLYIKHCNDNITYGRGGNSTPWMVALFAGRKNFGIDQSVVESLSIFIFGVLQGQKEGLDCAVSLNKFEATERVLHMKCVDTWLDANSMCPLCRYRVDLEDILLVEDTKPFHQTHQQRNNKHECMRLTSNLEKQELMESRRRHLPVGVEEGEKREEEQHSRRWMTLFRRLLDSISATLRKKNVLR